VLSWSTRRCKAAFSTSQSLKRLAHSRGIGSAPASSGKKATPTSFVLCHARAVGSFFPADHEIELVGQRAHIAESEFGAIGGEVANQAIQRGAAPVVCHQAAEKGPATIDFSSFQHGEASLTIPLRGWQP